jgi:hypothetical protein
MHHYSFIIIILIVTIYLFNFTNLSNFNPFIIKKKKEKFEDCPYGCGCRRCMRRMGNCPLMDDTT